MLASPSSSSVTITTLFTLPPVVSIEAVFTPENEAGLFICSCSPSCSTISGSDSSELQPVKASATAIEIKFLFIVFLLFDLIFATNITNLSVICIYYLQCWLI